MTSTDTNPVDFSVADVLAWVRTKPADEAYDFTESLNCALAQFGRATNRPHLIDVIDPSEDYAFLYSAINPEDGTLEDDQIDWTFGSLALRLEALIPKPSVWISPDAYLIDLELAMA